MKTRVLLVDDDRDFCETLEIGLRRRGCEVTCCNSTDSAETALTQQTFDVVVTDVRMNRASGIDLCRYVADNRPDVPVIVLTAFGVLETAVAAIRAGAYDFISKPIELDALAIAIDRAAKHRSLREEVKRLRDEIDRARGFDDLVGQSPAMLAVHDLIERLADSDASVLLTGESGTGKELIARELHKRSHRASARFIAINCAAMPASLLESELFGHLKGAFTDARADRVGLFQKADGGTVLLDEIGDMPIELQPKLLRVLQERTIRPVGATEELPVDVRVLAATNRDLESAIEAGTFREDLFYRINVVNLPLPPLRARAADILPLAQHFLAHVATKAKKAVVGIAPAAAERLRDYNWPGNVRELQNCIERSVTLTRFDRIVVEDLPTKVREHRPSHVLVATDDPSELVPMEEIERRYVARVMDAVGNNKTAAARILGFDRKRLSRMLERLGLERTK